MKIITEYGRRVIFFAIAILIALSTLAPSIFAQTNFTILHSFDDFYGWKPVGGLMQGKDGAIYGTSSSGGVLGNGTVFRMNKDGSDLVVLNNSVGDIFEGPSAGLLLGTDGNLFGVTLRGGDAQQGMIFKMGVDGTGYSIIHSFSDVENGIWPASALIEGSDGALYGTTAGAFGTIFKVTKDGGSFTVIHHFTPTEDYHPGGKLLEGSDGALYGTTAINGGSLGMGTIFKVNKDGSAFSILHDFGADAADGKSPAAGLMKGTDGFLYGTTQAGPGLFSGTVFKLREDGSGYEVIHQFDVMAGEGGGPTDELVEGSDGALYGTFSSEWGGVYRLSKDGSGFTVLKAFSGGINDGSSPTGSLLETAPGVYLGMAGSVALFGGCIYALSSSSLPSKGVHVWFGDATTFVQFSATSGTVYDVQRSTDLHDWTMMATMTAGNDGQIILTDTNSPTGFYRLKLH